MSTAHARRLIRILFLADTHLGFDLPERPRTSRHRGEDFFTNFSRALEPANRGEVDLVLHGGDLLFRSKVRLSLVGRAMEPLREVADRGIPVFIVPGNHERSRIPFPILAIHPRIFLFDRPRTYVIEKSGIRLALAGFPCERSGVRVNFGRLVEETGWRSESADISLLCLHQVVEGAQVGIRNFTFRHGDDVISGQSIPPGFAAVLSGHIHRHQILVHDLQGFPLPSPVFYPGSIERTAFDERLERKGYLIMTVAHPGDQMESAVSGEFIELPSRPMIVREIDLDTVAHADFEGRIKRFFERLDPRSIVSLRFTGSVRPAMRESLRLESLRLQAPASMMITTRFPGKQELAPK